MIKGLVCTVCGRQYPASDLLTCDECGCDQGILDVEYDYEAARSLLTRERLASRSRDHWRYRELLPIPANAQLPTLQVGWTPLYDSVPLRQFLGVRRAWLKDEGRNPTASFKDRASSVAAVKAREHGFSTIACASTGNAASSLAGFAANMRLTSFIFVPQRAPEPKITQLLVFGANVIRVRGTYEQAYELCAQAVAENGWYSRNCAVNCYLVEGKKTCGLEIGEQLGESIPDWVVVSVGDGCTIAGVWKGLKEMYLLGMIPRLPRMLGVQAEGSPAVARQFARSEEPKQLDKYSAETIADSICVGVPRNWRKAVRAVRESGGEYVTVTDDQIMESLRVLPRLTGVFAEPAAAASVAGILEAKARQIIGSQDEILAVITGNGLKDIRTAAMAVGKPIDIDPTMDHLNYALRKMFDTATVQLNTGKVSV